MDLSLKVSFKTASVYFKNCFRSMLSQAYWKVAVIIILKNSWENPPHTIFFSWSWKTIISNANKDEFLGRRFCRILWKFSGQALFIRLWLDCFYKTTDTSLHIFYLSSYHQTTRWGIMSIFEARLLAWFAKAFVVAIIWHDYWKYRMWDTESIFLVVLWIMFLSQFIRIREIILNAFCCFQKYKPPRKFHPKWNTPQNINYVMLMFPFILIFFIILLVFLFYSTLKTLEYHKLSKHPVNFLPVHSKQ